MICLKGNKVVEMVNMSGDFVTSDFSTSQKGSVSIELKGTGVNTFDVYIQGSNSRINWIDLTGFERTGLDNSVPHGWDIPTDFEWLRISIRNATGTFDTLDVYQGKKA